MKPPKLQILPVREYVGVNRDDPIRFYALPVIGSLYRRRVELCLGELKGGERVLEIGFGSGVSFFNLNELYSEIDGLDLTASVSEVSGFFQQRGITTYLRSGSVLDMPYPDDYFDAVLLVSILEHLRLSEQLPAFSEIRRVLKKGGQVVYGLPVERPLMVFMFRLLGYNIREHHFSTHVDVYKAASSLLEEERVVKMHGPVRWLGSIYEVGHFSK